MNAQTLLHASHAFAVSSNSSRRGLLKTAAALGLSLASLRGQAPRPDLPEHNHERVPIADLQNQDPDDLMPNGKSRKEAVAKAEHEKALKDADALIALSNQLKDEIAKSGTFVVSTAALKKTTDIEKLARSVRGHMEIYANAGVK
jgi:hypothetical protein